MNQDDKQAVTEVEPDEESLVENQDARDDEPTMDELLDKIESDQKQEQEASQEVQPKPETQDADLRIAALEKESQERNKTDLVKDLQTGMVETVGRFLENDTISKVYDNDEVEGLIQIEASRNPRISIAFGLRHSKPSEWRRIETALMKKIEDRAAGKVSRNNEDRETAEDAVRGVSTIAPVTESKIPQQSELAGLSDKDLHDLKRELDPDFGA